MDIDRFYEAARAAGYAGSREDVERYFREQEARKKRVDDYGEYQATDDARLVLQYLHEERDDLAAPICRRVNQAARRLKLIADYAMELTSDEEEE